MNNAKFARPYAKAAFEFAVMSDSLPQWLAFLQNLASLAKNPKLNQVFSHPEITRKQRFFVLDDLLKKELNKENENFLHTLIEHRRFNTIQTILNLFLQLKADYEKILCAEVTSTFPLTHSQKEDLTTALKKKFNRDIQIKEIVDQTILGGAIIRIGDQVIDGSGRTKLHQLQQHLKGSVLCN